ncbi:HAD family hydrolase [Streptomyces aidingensis]|uniref:Haloacid dehalogenase superfamily, subfamily IA, variant 3 with third motif having DD or ED n=1 Tax=Streptomyces aidingensis TaxID=910347 RepID=A0A1I1HQV4_9ACTN|nr:HAD-IA family hydrolase [Streptomyces aidingensis]SFC26519.1 haloacid dehalogenase superfamily, subfamily IA, variant 3 with third motif having DD or ED [Streptomyces aidingensis]
MRQLLSGVDSVLLDFDGPVCSLFAARPAADVAQRLRELACELGVAPRLLAQGPAASEDPHAVLLALAGTTGVRGLARRLEHALTQQEVRAATTARPTPGARELIHALQERGIRPAIVTNNSPLAVTAYLTGQRLLAPFAGRVHGRVADLSLLKPHPDPVRRALRSTGTAAERSVLIGDSPSDLAAARAAGVPFLGFAPHAAAESALCAAGARHITSSLRRVRQALGGSTFG